jgi:hypothetical protein
MTGEFYEQALGRMTRIAAALGAAGAIGAVAARGLRPAAGFLIGAIISLINFRWWVGLAGAIGGSAKPPLRGSAAILGLRYVLVAGVVYAIVKILEITLVAVLAGMFVSVAAVILEILYELIYARK